MTTWIWKSVTPTTANLIPVVALTPFRPSAVGKHHIQNAEDRRIQGLT